MYRLLIINPGSTSTKVAVYEDQSQQFVESVSHSAQELSVYEHIIDQFEFRKGLIVKLLEEKGYHAKDFDAIVARGGILPPIKTGGYRVNDDMIWQLKNKPALEHASNLGAVIADAIGRPAGVPSYIYDAVSADEMEPILKITGLPELKRKGQGHNLNLRAAAMRYAKEAGKPIDQCNLVIAHLGGGSTIALFKNGRIIDVANDEDGPFTPERAGALPMLQLIELFMDESVDRAALKKRIKSGAGLTAHCGTNDARQVEKMIEAGDKKAAEVYRAMAISVAKCIGKEAVLVNGNIEAVILTGGIAYSKRFTEMVSEYVSFLGPVKVYAGENEMLSLALGGLRILNQEEPYHEFVKVL